MKIHFAVAKTPHQNVVVKRKKKTVHEMVRTMLKDSNFSDIFWAQAIHIEVHILNR
jgi:hypothetical protein